MNRILILPIILFLLLASCTETRQQEKDNPEKIYVDSLTYNFEPFLNGMTYKYVKLQTTEDCLITTISRIKRDDSLLFIMDSKQHLYVFDIYGHYRRTIGSKGGSKKEFINMYDFFLIKEKKEIGIIDRAKCDYLLFDYDGKFIDRKSLPREPFTATNCCERLNNLFVFNNYFYNGHPYNYTTYNQKSHTTKNELPYIKAPNEAIFGGCNAMCNLDNKILCRAQLSDTIFQYTETGLKPAYEIISHNQHLTKSDLINISDDELLNLSSIYEKTKKSIGIISLFATDSLLIIQYNQDGINRRCSYNTKKKIGIIDFDGDCRHNFIYSDSKCFISLIDTENYEEYKDIKEMPNELKQIIESSKANDNPILTIIE
ncbi:MAG: 6-bladed beta-propeller [Bacteroidales bacterium]|nr:6-bladed beta-propeller [Bacteroidales bacterium]